jgi:hypothetical protein
MSSFLLILVIFKPKQSRPCEPYQDTALHLQSRLLTFLLYLLTNHLRILLDWRSLRSEVRLEVWHFYLASLAKVPGKMSRREEIQDSILKPQMAYDLEKQLR